LIPIDLLTGPARECMVPRELRFDLAPEQRAEKPLWAWDQAFDAIDALVEAGAAVVEGEILVVAEDGAVSQVPWEPWLTGARIPEHPPAWRRWYLDRASGEPWERFVARAAAHARTRARELAGEARAVHVDLSWATVDELALFEPPGWVRPARRRFMEQGGTARDWFRRPSSRMRCVGRTAPGSYFGGVTADLDRVPPDARYAGLLPRGDPARIADFTSLEVLRLSECTDAALPYVGRLAGLREIYVQDNSQLSSLEPIAGLSELWFAYVGAGDELRDPRPLAALPRLRYLYLTATGLRELSGLAGLTQLNSLHLVAHDKVDSLAPLASLGNLRHLSVWMNGVREGGLAPLAALRGLRSLDVSANVFRLDELAPLAAALPRADGPFRSPFLDPYFTATDPCRRCGREDVVVTLGKPRRELCPDCDASAVRNHVIRWEVLLSAASAERGDARA
jgi:hypothetical protein